MTQEQPHLAILLIELSPGKASVALRWRGSRTIQLLDGWEDLDPGRAVVIAARIVQGQISADEVARRPYREIELPETYWQKLEATEVTGKDEEGTPQK